MKRILEIVKKWLLIPLLPFSVMYLTGWFQGWTTGKSIASVLSGGTPSADYIQEVNKHLAATVMTAVIYLIDIVLVWLDKWKGIEVTVGFRRDREIGYAEQMSIGRVEDDVDPLNLVIEVRCPKPGARTMLRWLVPDLQVRLSYLTEWLKVDTDDPSPFNRVTEGSFSVMCLPLLDLIGDGKGTEIFLLYVHPKVNRREEGTMHPSLHSRHRLRLWLARRIVLKTTEKTLELRLKAPAITVRPAQAPAVGGT